MKDENKTKKQLISELIDLRRQIAKGIKAESERSPREEEHEKLEARLRTAIESLPFDFFGIDVTGHYFIQNTTCKMLWGDIIGKRPEDLSVDKNTLALWLDNNRRAFSGEIVKGEIEFIREGEKRYYYNIIAPIYNKGIIDGILGFNVDITERKKAEEALKEREKELQIEARNLEEANVALKVLLKRRDEDKAELEDNVLLNIKGLVTPYLEKLKMSGLDKSQKAYVTILEASLNQVTSPFLHRLSFSFSNFTPTEIQVANLLKQGKTNKEIGELLNSSSRTIAFHRDNIRKKLGLKNKKTNLKSHLLSLK
jgi:PAS domain S-box-containing protein